MYSNSSSMTPGANFPMPEMLAQRCVDSGNSPQVPMPGGCNAMSFSLTWLRERIALLTEIGLPCLLQFGVPGNGGALTELRGWLDLSGDGLCLLGDRFSVLLHRRDVGSISLVSQCAGELALSVRIADRDGVPIASLFGLINTPEGAVWADVMGNPCYTNDEPV